MTATAALGARLAALGVIGLALAAPVRAQQPDTLPIADALPIAIAREAVARYNAPATLRLTEATTIDSTRIVDGDIAALEAPLVVAGVVRGDITSINGGVTLRPGARVDGGIFVVGGVVTGLESARVGGEVRAWQAPLRFTREGETIVAAEPGGAEPLLSWVRFHGRRERGNGLRVANYATYNRVEGLPIYVGPYITRSMRRGTVTAELFGVIRSAENFAWTSENIGHRATLELRSGGPLQLVVGGRLQDVVEPVESWQVGNSEAALGTFVLHRDLRDWYSRAGGSAWLGVAGPRTATLMLTLADERWASRKQRDPWTLFRDAQPWRPNPTIDDGRFHTLRLTGSIDTRNDPNDPKVGWWATAELEAGRGELTATGARSAEVLPGGRPVPPQLDSYRRLFLDVRRYNRLSPETQLNGRVVLGGWLGGDQLPLQRTLSLGGLGSLPGYDARDRVGDEDRLGCRAPIAAPGKPAECERIALAQLEYRLDLGLERFRRRFLPTWYADAAVVVFVDAGRGWRIDRGDGSGGLAASKFPSLDSFASDVGAGIDLSVIGVYVAKAVSVANEPPNVYVRLKHRF